MNNIQNHKTELLPQLFASNGPELIFPLQEPSSQIYPWQSTLNPTHEPDPDPFLIFPPPPVVPPSPYGSFFYRRSQGLQFGYEDATSATSQYHDGFRILSEALGPMVQNGSDSGPFINGLQGEFGRLTTAQDILDAKALAASKSHSEAERRRRERINNHLAKLRTLLPNTTKTDKASLLAEVIQQVKELKRQTSVIAESNPTIPTETNELTVEEDGEFIVKATFCCDDRSDILPELIKTLKTLQLKTLKAEIVTVGCRVKNVLFIAGDGEGHCVNSIREALKAVMEKNGCGEEKFSSGNAKRQRTNSINILGQQHLI